MGDPLLVTGLLFGGMLFFLAVGVPIAITLSGVSIAMIAAFWSPMALTMVPMRAFSTTTSFEYLAIPLFVFMASMLQKAKVAEDMYDAMERFFGSVRGGLAIGTVLICTIFACMAGISGASTVSMGMIAVPAMLARGYGKDMALGTVAAGGSLGILIPPSVTMIVYALVSGTSVGKLYAGGLVPGLLLAALFCVYILVRGWLQPSTAGGTSIRAYSWSEKLVGLRGLFFPLVIVVAVLGSMFTGIASVSESAAVGAAGSLIAALCLRRLRWTDVKSACHETLMLSCMIFWIIIGASALSTFYTGMGAGRMIESFVLGLEVNRWVILVGMQLILLLMGMVLDTVGIIMITVPIFLPIILALGFDPVWFGILFIINMEIGFLSPPFGYNLFYLRGVTPPSITMPDIYRSVLPFIAIMTGAIVLMMAVPEIVLWLPRQLF
ncbi:TRAP transporter permease DctM/Q [Pollutimonas nitritireducens]|uniref:TRAP transporter large permease protein n=1 Tax=Pollutimonas nitritireducens TaxID=2045209 RepID=A0A2N4UC94_9BURK|nr:TRAP transporter large permease subunit [Pollutimonas nitritireducens]PLC52638.1 TRAP transporter permease DctM/Q [Pollutimonas nitritireducens]